MITTTTKQSTSTARAAPATPSLAASAKCKAFVIVFGISVPIIYVLCEWFNLPLFTYHPATNRVEFWWGPPRSGEGPTMYWYGWTLLSLIVGSVLGLFATMLPASLVEKIPLALVWLLPILAFIALAYSLMPFWTK